MSARLAALAAAALCALAACGSPAADASSSDSSAPVIDPAGWTGADDVIAGLEEAGIACAPEGAEPEVVPGLTVDGQPWEALVRVDCAEYSFFLWVNPGEVLSSDAAACVSFNAEFWDEIDARIGVTGANFAVATASGQWPEALPPETFTVAFGGIVESDGAYFERLGCTRP